MFKFLKKEAPAQEELQEVFQKNDWTKDIKLSLIHI